MKKKVLLTLIPALMILGSCAGNAPQAKEQLFQEDNLLHEEIFGDVSSLFGKAKRNALPEDDDSLIPTVGIQRAVGKSTISIRFVAATYFEKDNLEDTEAVWTRTLYDASGKAVKVAEGKPSTLTYTALRDGNGARYTIKDFNDRYGTNYKSFVVYTMINIPNQEKYYNYFLNAYLTLAPLGEETTHSNTLSTNVNGTRRVSFPYNSTGYFLKGALDGEHNILLPQDSGEFPGYVARFSTGSSVHKDGTFYVVYNSASNFAIYDSSSLSYSGNEGIANFFENSNGKIKAKSTNEYTLYLNNSGKLSLRYINVNNGSFITGENKAYCWTWNSEDLGDSSRWVKVENNMIPLASGDNRVKPAELLNDPADLKVWNVGEVNKSGANDYVIPSENESSLTHFADNCFTWDEVPTENGFTLVINDTNFYATEAIAGNQVKATLNLTAGDKIKILEKNSSGTFYYSKGYEDGVVGFTWADGNLTTDHTGKYTLYLKNTNVDNKIFWIEPVAYLVLNRGGAITKTQAAINNGNEIKVLNFSLEVGDIFYFDMSYSMCKYYDDIKTDSTAYSSFTKSSEEYGPIEVTTAGNYNFYVAIFVGSGQSIWIENA